MMTTSLARRACVMAMARGERGSIRGKAKARLTLSPRSSSGQVEMARWNAERRVDCVEAVLFARLCGKGITDFVP